ncbi:hypothetical protein GCM10010168_50940 [Actinoplanes ianthinogenes]|uniref:Septum formation-related domain-containing protein n=1 Tax=Actinoplanes ianthinogenes TaxID=122358 RepID=A0ABN6CM63_9ACTN|nr:DUF4190 domain-containing protein [Actinoplanes ianthinogenes]BCJ46145.1 hypothetical protein Aiant_68020 [Actinoplanes ianthinogenes]GGR26571.1 hypothetical protein GCM10010168_50940 [Actinoplanes ianthinogenes]
MNQDFPGPPHQVPGPAPAPPPHDPQAPPPMYSAPPPAAYPAPGGPAYPPPGGPAYPAPGGPAYPPPGGPAYPSPYGAYPPATYPGHQPYPGQPYPPTGYPPPIHPAYPMYGPAPKREINNAAIAALFFAAIGALPLGVILGFVALSQIAKRGERGRGLAIGALSVASLYLLIGVTAILVDDDDDGDEPPAAGRPPAATATAPVRTGSTSGPGRRDVEDLQLGDCLSYVDPDGSAESFTVELCSQSHGGEVYDIWTFPAGAYPGDTEADETAGDRCGKDLKRYAVGKFANARVLYVYPTRASWDFDRRVVCIAVPPTGEWEGSMVHP